MSMFKNIAFRLFNFLMIVLIGSLVMPLSSYADVITHRGFDVLDIQDGLPDNIVSGIGQDEQGFMWFASRKGLTRYDGYDFKNYQPEGDLLNQNALEVTNLLVARDSRVWLFTAAQGVLILDPISGDFSELGFLQADSTSTSDWNVLGFSEASDGAIWAVTDQGSVVRIDTSKPDSQPTWTWHRHPAENEAPFTSLCSTSAGNIWLGSEKGDILVLNNQGLITNTLKTPLWDEVNRAKVLNIFESSNGDIWFCSNVGVFRLQPQSEVFELLQPKPTTQLTNFNVITHISEDSSGTLWLGSYVGLYKLDPGTKQFDLYSHDQTDPGSPPRGPILQTYCGTSGIVWASCWFSGVIKYNPAAISFQIENYNHADMNGLAENSVNSLFEDSNGVLWVGTGHPFPGGSRGVLHRRRPGSEQFERWFFPNKRVTVINSIFRDKNQKLWVGTNYGLWHFDEKNSEPLVIAEDIPATLEMDISVMNDDDAGHLWIGTVGNGLFKLDLETGSFHHFQQDPEDDLSLTARTVLAIRKDTKGKVWFGTDGGGLNFFDETNNSFQHFLQHKNFVSNVSSLVPQPDGSWWLGTYGGLVEFHPDSGIGRQFTILSGLPSEIVTQLQFDESGYLWFTNGTGLVRLDPETDQLTIFSEEDGISDFGTSFTSIKNQDGRFIFGGAGGLLEFDPSEFVKVEFSPPVVFSEITVNGELFAGSPFSRTASISSETHEHHLNYKENDISLTFAALDYSSYFGALYRYRMDGVDQQWSEPSKLRFAKYSNLSPGKYTFQVLASNGQGQWNPREARTTFIIHKPWWETWWARVMYLIIALAILAFVRHQLIARQRIKRTLALNKTKALHMADMSQLKAKFLVNVAHEFHGPLTLIKNLAQQKSSNEANGNSRSLAMLERNASRLEYLTDQLSSLAKLETGGLEIKLSHGSTVSLLRELAMMYRAVCKKRGTRFVLHSPNDTGDGWIDFNLLEKIFTNLLVNAVKFTDYRGVIDVQINLNEGPFSNEENQDTSSTGSRLKNGNHFLLEIKVTCSGYTNLTDNPEKVFDRFYTSIPSDTHKSGDSGIGLTLVKEFSVLLGGSVSSKITSDGLTCFKAMLPVMNSDSYPQEKKSGDSNGVLTPEASAIVKASLCVADHIPSEKNQHLGASRSVPDSTELKTILVIAQDADMRSFLRSKLGAEFSIVEAIEGGTGLEMAVSDTPDLILCDEQIGEMTSIEYCRKLKEKSRTQTIPLLVFVDGEDDGTRKSIYEAGVDDCVKKPFNFDEVRQRIMNLMDQRARMAKRFSENTDPQNSIALPASEDDFMASLNLIVEQNLEDPDFKVENLANELFMSRRTLQRKLLELTDQTGSNYLRNKRLQRAAKLLAQRYSNVTDVSLAVGYKNPSNFSRAFREYFGISPSEYRKGQL